jgi:uncharacterized protein YndB with AHSA1/START domain
MGNNEQTFITVSILANVPVDTAWAKWTTPADIIHWNFASNDWQCPVATNDLRPGGKFNYRMEAKDGSMGFDFEGTYNQVIINELIEYKIIGGRQVTVSFATEGDDTKVTETFEAEDENSLELQQAGWQAILDNFKKHVESGDTHN